MASFFDEISKNRLRSALLMMLFGLLFFAIIYVIVWYFGGGIFGLALGAILIAGYAAFAYSSGSKVVLKISGARQADRAKYPSLFSAVEGLAAASQIPIPSVYIINDPSPNAFATGRDRRHASIAVTTGLLSIMDTEELQGVIAHEMSHIYNGDMQFMMIAIVFAGVIGLVAAIIRMSVFFGGFGGRRGEGNFIVLIIALALSVLAPLFALLIRLAISRRREYMADANGGRITRNPGSLADALQKIKDYTSKPNAVPVQKANDMTASMYFSNPLRARSISNIFSTHPPIDERIKRLRQMY